MSLSRNAQVLKYFAQQHTRGIGRMRLQNLAYLADLEARRYLGKPVTTFEYTWSNNGPLDDGLYAAIDEIERLGLASQIEIPWPSYVEHRLVDAGKAVPFTFTAPESAVLSFVADKYLDSPLARLLSEVVYETRPMQDVGRKGDRLPMEIVDNEGRNELGYDLEAVLEAEKEMEQGRFTTASALFDELRGRIGTGPA
jgi:hypothetical protein